MDETLPTFGESLRARRRSLGLSQRDVAIEAGLSLRALRNIEQGRVRRPHPRSMRGLAEVLQWAGVGGADPRGTVGGADPRGTVGGADPRGTVGASAGHADRSRDGADAPPAGSPDPPPPHIAVLGPLEISRGGAIDLTAVRLRSLLALLAIQPGQVVPVEEIADALWSGEPPRSWPQAVHHYVWRLRALLEPGRSRGTPAQTLARVGDGYRLETDANHLDLLRFEALSARARRASAGDEPDQVLQLWGQALRCWRGPVLAGLGAELRQHPTAVAIAGRRVAATLAHADLAIELGWFDPTLEFLRAVAADEPLHEGLHARLMIALAGAGQQAAALATFTTVRRRLADELGVEPGAELRQAHLRVLRHDLPANGSPPTGRGRGPVPPAQLPTDVPAFVGRAEHLARLDGLLASRRSGGDTAVNVVTIGGGAGVGKTTLGVHWARRVADQFGHGQLYVNLRGFDAAGSAMDPDEALRGFLSALGVPNERIPTALEAQIGLYRSLLAGRRLLIVLDNARDAQQVRPLLPGTPDCMALVTSRNRLAGLVATNGAHPLTVEVLTRAEAHALLAARLGARRLAGEPEAVNEILDRCAGLPLALAIVAARAVARPQFPLAALAEELGEVPGGLDGFDGGEPATDVRAVLSWSYRALTPAAARLFRHLGPHPGADITAHAAVSLADVPLGPVRRLLAELTDANMVREHTGGRYSCHDLLRAYAVELAYAHDSEAGRHAALCRVLDHYLHTADAAEHLLNPHRHRAGVDAVSSDVRPQRLADSRAALAWFSAERAVLLDAVRLAARVGQDRRAWQLADVTALYLDRQGRWPELRATQQIALDAARRDGDVDGQGHAHRHLGGALLELGSLDDAHDHYRRAADLFDQSGDDVSQAYAHLGTAMVFDRQRRYADALRHAELALALYRRAGRRPGQAHALNSIAWYRVELGDNHAQAIRDCRRALAIQSELADPQGEAHTWDTLGYAHHRHGDHEAARVAYERALDLFQHTGERYYAADTLNRLGDTWRAAGDVAAAGDAWRRALEILIDLDHPDADDVRTKLATL
jgi:DNA-binding SARP family transcriptional activator/tetratricopeptide (TPR) repeat protein